MKKELLTVAGVAAITLVLSGCSIISGLLGGPDPRCAVIQKAFADQLDSSGAPKGTFEAFNIAKADDLPGSAKLPAATCGYRFSSGDGDSTVAYFGFYLSKDDAREDTVGDALKSAGFADSNAAFANGGGGHYWSSAPKDDGSHVIIGLSQIKDAGLDGDETFLKALGKDGDLLSVIFTG